MGEKGGKLKFCEEGHVFDSVIHDRCPDCGSPPAGAADRQTGDAAPDARNAASEISHAGADSATQQAVSRSTAMPLAGSAAPIPLRFALPVVVALGALALLFLLTRGGEEAGEERRHVAERGERLIERRDEEEGRSNADPGLASAVPEGLWETFVNLGPAAGRIRQVFEIRENGTYVLHDQVYGHAGRMTFAGRHYSLTSRTNPYEDEGVFSRPDRDTLVFEGRLGRSVWTALQQQPLFRVTTEGPVLPMDVPGTVRRMRDEARTTWREDAMTVSLEIDRTKYGSPQIRSRFVSPRDMAGLTLTWRQFDGDEFAHEAVNWGSTALPDRFLDLPAAYGFLDDVSPLRRATLRWEGGQLRWSLVSERGTGGAVDASYP